MSTLHWVRHGPTHAKAMVGWTDLPADLSDIDCLRRLSALLPDAPVISSTLTRAVATADAIQGNRPAPAPTTRTCAKCISARGKCAPTTRSRPKIPNASAPSGERPGEVRPPGGESWDDLRGPRRCRRRSPVRPRRRCHRRGRISARSRRNTSAQHGLTRPTHFPSGSTTFRCPRSPGPTTYGGVDRINHQA